MKFTEMYTQEYVAKFLTVSVKTLELWRRKNKGPKFIRLCGPNSSVRYPEDWFNEYLEERLKEAML